MGIDRETSRLNLNIKFSRKTYFKYFILLKQAWKYYISKLRANNKNIVVSYSFFLIPFFIKID